MSGAFKLEDIQALGPVIVADGQCHAVAIVDRSKDCDIGRPLIEIWVQDDENWFRKTSFSAYWLPQLINALQRALSTLDTKEMMIPTYCTRPEGHDGPCNGWPCEYVRGLHLGGENV